MVERTDFQVGEKAQFSKTITDSDLSIYAGLVGDFNRMHVDAEYAKKTAVGSRTAHEMLAGGLITTVLSCKLPGSGFKLLRQQLEFLSPILVGDTVTAVAEVVSWQAERRIITLRTTCFNQSRTEVITGEAVLMMLDRQ
jgi:acyl dehydratase